MMEVGSALRLNTTGAAHIGTLVLSVQEERQLMRNKIEHILYPQFDLNKYQSDEHSRIRLQELGRPDRKNPEVPQ